MPKWPSEPWSIIYRGKNAEYIGKILPQGNAEICSLLNTVYRDEQNAIARLISKAPAMAESLRAAADFYRRELDAIGPCDHAVDICSCGDRQDYDDLKSLLAEIEGGE